MWLKNFHDSLSEHKMRFQKKVTNKEFAQEILVGSIALASLFAIFLFVAIQKATGKSLSPLAYVWPPEESESDEGIPVVVFRTEEDRRNAFDQYDSTKPKLDKLLAKFNASTERMKQERLAKENKLEAPNKLDSDSKLFTGSLTLGTSEKTDRVTPAGGTSTKKELASTNPIQLANHLDDSSLTGNHNSPKSTFIPSVNSNEKPPASFDPTRFDKKGTSNVSAPPSSFPANSRRIENQENSFAPSQTAPPSNFQVNNLSPQNISNIEPTKNNLPLKPSASSSYSLTDSKPEAGLRQPLRTQTATERNSTSDLLSKDRQEQKRKVEKNALRVSPETSDSFWSLSQTYYGDGKYFDKLARFNNATKDSDNLPRIVLVPSLNELLDYERNHVKKTGDVKKSETPVERDIHITKQNETLFEIARDQLGSAARFVELIQMNKSALPINCDAQTELTSGLRLQLPKK